MQNAPTMLAQKMMNRQAPYGPIGMVSQDMSGNKKGRAVVPVYNAIATTMPSSASWSAAAFGNGVFVAIAYNGTVAATSTNGIDWTARTLPASAFWYYIAYGNNSFLAIAYNGTVAATSPDGITWTSRTLPSASPWGYIAFGAGKFAVIAGVTASTVAATIDYAINATSFVLPNVQTLTGTTAYIKAS